MLCPHYLVAIFSIIGTSNRCAMAQLWSHSYADLLRARQLTTVPSAFALHMVECLSLSGLSDLNAVCMQVSGLTNIREIFTSLTQAPLLWARSMQTKPFLSPSALRLHCQHTSMHSSNVRCCTPLPMAAVWFAWSTWRYKSWNSAIMYSGLQIWMLWWHILCVNVSSFLPCSSTVQIWLTFISYDSYASPETIHDT